MASRLVFSERGHRYSLDGKRIPGVTGIIRKATDKPALVYAAGKEAALWASINREAYEVMGADEWIARAAAAPRIAWDAKADRGKLLHEAARQLVRGDPLTPETDGVEWPDDVIRSAEQLADFFNVWNVDPLYAEAPVYSRRHWYAGTIDLIAGLRDNRRWLLDYKTGETGIWPETSMQLCAYRHADHLQIDDENGRRDIDMPRVDSTAAVWIRPDHWELIPVRSDAMVFETFLHMIPVSRWAEWRKEESVAEPVPAP
jgi:hypothetical protein